MFEPPLLERYNQLKGSSDRQGRGRAFELLLVDLFRQAHFKVDHDPDAAAPRQTDVYAAYGESRYLIEAKWMRRPSDVDHYDNLVARLNRTQHAVVGVLFSVAGFTETVLTEVCAHRDRPILLVGEVELLRVLSRPEELVGLLRRKYEQLVVHARVCLEERSTPTPTTARLVSAFPVSDVRLLDLEHRELPYLEGAGAFGQFTFVQSLPDIDWVSGSGLGTCLDLAPEPFTGEGLIEVLHHLDRLGWATDQPRWSIQLSTKNWHGIGVRSLVQALREWERRAETMPDAHHTEQLAYYDVCAGGYFSLTAAIATHESRITYECELSFQLVGVPLDTAPLHHLRDALDITEPCYFRTRAKQSVERHRLFAVDAVPLTPVAYLVSESSFGPEKKDWVTGIVAWNPFHKTDAKAPEGWPDMLGPSELLVCDLSSHHPLDQPRDAYHLYGWETAWASSAMTARVVVDW